MRTITINLRKNAIKARSRPILVWLSNIDTHFSIHYNEIILLMQRDLLAHIIFYPRKSNFHLEME